ncbi:MAG TPA: hypothetical protein VFE07_05100 [Marmoricola sp.]|jgi:hypothetical protein|nr:hypothetical protein [Marmoricola sp.]
MRRPADTLVSEALRQLDPAPRTDLTAAEVERADAAFARIVATHADEPVPTGPGRPHRRRTRLLVTVGLAGAAGVAVPGLLLGGSAYGSWTPTPEPLTAATADAAASTCRAALGVPDRGERVAVAERRGDWTYVLLAGAGTEAVCLMPDDLVGQEHPDNGAFFGSYDTDTVAPPTLDPVGIDEATSAEGSTDEGWFVWTAGYVGSNVTGVTVHTSAGRDIEASVVGNRFAAWWPSHKQSSDHPAETWSYSLHLSDGRTVTPAR